MADLKGKNGIPPVVQSSKPNSRSPWEERSRGTEISPGNIATSQRFPEAANDLMQNKQRFGATHLLVHLVDDELGRLQRWLLHKLEVWVPTERGTGPVRHSRRQWGNLTSLLQHRHRSARPSRTQLRRNPRHKHRSQTLSGVTVDDARNTRVSRQHEEQVLEEGKTETKGKMCTIWGQRTRGTSYVGARQLNAYPTSFFASHRKGFSKL